MLLAHTAFFNLSFCLRLCFDSFTYLACFCLFSCFFLSLLDLFLRFPYISFHKIDFFVTAHSKVVRFSHFLHLVLLFAFSQIIVISKDVFFRGGRCKALKLDCICDVSVLDS